MHKDKPKILSRQVIAQSRLFSIEAVDLQFSNGVQVSFERLLGSDAVMIIPVLNNELIIIREYAAGIDQYCLCFPKGRLEDGESALEGANREIQEEIGYASHRLHFCRKVATAPGYTNFNTHIVIAQDLYPSQLPGDEPEVLEVIKVPLTELDQLMLREEFIEARSQLGLYILKQWLLEQPQSQD